MSCTTLHFPSQETIVAYLEQHPLTKDPYFKETGIIQAVAEIFANIYTAETNVAFGVMVTLKDLKEKIALPPEPIGIAIKKNLTEALKECAAGKPLAIEKK